MHSALLLVVALSISSGDAGRLTLRQTQKDPVQEQSSSIKKVVTMLEEMKKTVEKEANDDQVAYDKYMCWCVTNEKEKTAAIANAEQMIADLTAFIEEAAAKMGALKTEIEALTGDIADDNNALQTAMSVRKKENDEFVASEADMKETRGLLGEAIEVLKQVQLVQKKGGQATAEMRQADAVLAQIRTAVHKQSSPRFESIMQRDLFDIMGSLQSVRQHGAAEIQEPVVIAGTGGIGYKSDEQLGKEANPNDLVGGAAGAKSYNSRSGQILGILAEMRDEMSRDLGTAQKTELEAEILFQNLRAAKLGEIAAATEQKKQKEASLAETQDKSEKAKKDKSATEEAKAADEKFLANLKENCAAEDESYKERVAVRTEEIRALGEAIKILTADDSRELFSKTIAFLQVDKVQRAAAAEQAAAQERLADRAMQRIAKVARRHKNWALVSLAVHVKLDAFTKVKEVMDKMLAELKKQQKDEYDKWEACKKDIDETEDTIKVKTHTKEDLDEKHQDLSNTIESLTTSIAEMNQEVKDMEIALKQAGEERKAENQLFQQSVSDQRATINILQKASARLKMFYDESFVQKSVGAQTPGAASPNPPPKPSTTGYQKNEGGGGILQLIAKVISDAETEAKELETVESEQQERYAVYVRDTTESIEADRATITEKEAQKASAGAEKAETAEAQLANDNELDTLNKLLIAHHGDCDFVLQYFDIRQQARQEEMEAITDAKAILSGADFGK